MHIDLISVVVEDYNPAIAFYTMALGFQLVEDSAVRTDDGRPNRRVVVRPPGSQTGILLTRAQPDENPEGQARIGFSLQVADFSEVYDQIRLAGVEFVSEPRDEGKVRVVSFLDIAGNRWELSGG